MKAVHLQGMKADWCFHDLPKTAMEEKQTLMQENFTFQNEKDMVTACCLCICCPGREENINSIHLILILKESLLVTCRVWANELE